MQWTPANTVLTVSSGHFSVTSSDMTSSEPEAVSRYSVTPVVCVGPRRGGLTQSRDTEQDALTLYYLLEHGYIQRLGQLYQFLQFYRCLNTEEGRPIGSDARPALSHNLHGRHLLTTPTTPISPTPLRACVVNRRAHETVSVRVVERWPELCRYPFVVLRSADKPRHSTAAV